MAVTLLLPLGFLVPASLTQDDVYVGIVSLQSV